MECAEISGKRNILRAAEEKIWRSVKKNTPKHILSSGIPESLINPASNQDINSSLSPSYA
jgi:hypothetical protein